MCVDDRVVEVNGVNVEAMSHSEVVNQIRTNPVKAVLLVVDKITDAYLKKINRPVTADLLSYTDVHEMTIEEAEKLEELRLKDVTDGNEEGVNNSEEEDNKTDSPPDETPQELDVAQQQKLDKVENSPPSTPPVPPSQSEVNYFEHEKEKQEEIAPPSQEPEYLPKVEQTEPVVEDVPSVITTTTSIPAATENVPPPKEEENTMELKESDSSHHSSPNFQNGSQNEEDAVVDKKESKNDKLKNFFSKTPKRKEVKQKNTDWKSKLNEFNNL